MAVLGNFICCSHVGLHVIIYCVIYRLCEGEILTRKGADLCRAWEVLKWMIKL